MPAQYPNNLETIFNSSSPLAMRYAMQQQANAMNNDALDQQRQTLANQFTEQVNPIKVQQEQAGLDTTLAQLPGVQADSRLKQINTGVAEQTMPTDIASKISKNLASMDDDKIKRIEAMGQSMLQMADLAEGGQMPPLELQQTLPPEVVQLLGTAQGRAELKRKGQAVLMHTGNHLRQKAISDAQNASHEKVAAGNNATAIRVAEINAARPRGGAGGSGTSWYEKFKAAKSPREAATIASMQAEIARNEGDEETAAKWDVLANRAIEMWDAEMGAKYKPGIDPAATANTGNIVGTKPTQVPRSGKPQDFKKDDKGRILLD